MAQQSEPLDINSIESDFDNKENAYHHSNVLPCTEKGYEELNVSELNMKLHYTLTPVTSMSKSFTVCDRSLNCDTSNNSQENNLTRSLNSTISKNDNVIKTLRPLPLQSLATDQHADSTQTNLNNIEGTIAATNDIDENLSLPSSSSSLIHTPEATTPTADVPKNDASSPIMRGFKTVLNRIWSPRSPVPAENSSQNCDNVNVTETNLDESSVSKMFSIITSTPVVSKETNKSKRNSPYKDIIIFNDDLEKELQWKDDTKLITEDKLPINKSTLQKLNLNRAEKQIIGDTLTPENVNISCDQSVQEDILRNQSDMFVDVGSDSEFVDCETTLTQNNLQILDTNKTDIINQDLYVNFSIDTSKTNETTEHASKNTLCNNKDSNDLIFGMGPQNQDVPFLANIKVTKENEANNEVNYSSLQETYINDVHVLSTNTAQNCEGTSHKLLTKDIATSDYELDSLECNTMNNIIVCDKTLNEQQITVPLLQETVISSNIENNLLSKSIAFETSPAEIPLPDDDIDKEGNSANDHNEELSAFNDVPVTKEGIIPNNSVSPQDFTFDINATDCDEFTGNLSSVMHELQLLINDRNTTNTRKDIIDGTHNTIPKDITANEINMLPDLMNHIINHSKNTLDCAISTVHTAEDINLIPMPEEDMLTLKETTLQGVTSIPVELNSDVNKCELSDEIKVMDVTITIKPDAVDSCENISDKKFENPLNVLYKTPNISVCKNKSDIIESEVENKIFCDASSLHSTIVSAPENVDSILNNTQQVENNMFFDTISNSDEHLQSIANEANIETLRQVEGVQSIVITEKDKVKNDLISESEPIGVVIKSNVDNSNVGTKEEEMLISANNSPYVSVSADLDKITIPESTHYIEKNENVCLSTRIADSLPPKSPPITSKGYNFNFDEIDDPFTTKTNIRTSPTPDIPVKINTSKLNVLNNKKAGRSRCKSQTQHSKQFTNMIHITEAAVSTNNQSEVQSENLMVSADSNNEKGPAKSQDVSMSDSNNFDNTIVGSKFSSASNNELMILELPKVEVESAKNTKISTTNCEHKPKNINNAVKDTSSSEMSTYYSAGSSSTDSIKSRNVFNIPEIDDINFNPFATKSKVRISPEPSLNTNDDPNISTFKSSTPNSSAIISSFINQISEGNNTKTSNGENSTAILLEGKMETEAMEKDSINVKNTITSSEMSDESTTLQEVNTEDEDTIEGPFIDVENLNKSTDITNIKIENSNLIQDTHITTQGPPENAETRETFTDAEDSKFLINENKNTAIADSGSETLFLNFDPLFTRMQGRQSTPKVQKSQKAVGLLVAGPSTLDSTFDVDNPFVSDTLNEDANITTSKPMMVVNPAVNPLPAPRKTSTPTRSLNRRSNTFASPAMAVIDRLLAMSTNNWFLGDTSSMQVTQEQHEADLALTQLRELLAEKEISVHNLRSESIELQDKLSAIESQMKDLDNESRGRLKKINELNEQLSEKTQINKSMASVVEEYERTIIVLLSEREHDKKKRADEKTKLIKEIEEQAAHLSSMEVSFNDLHSKYEKSKQVIMTFKANEDIYKKSIEEIQENQKKMQKNYELLKQHAASKLNNANQELTRINKAHEAEVLKLNAMLKRKEVHITSLEESLAQKIKVNDDLTKICDDLINRVR